MAAKDNFSLLFSLIILLPTLCFTQFFDSHQSKIDPFVKRVLTSTTNVGSVGGGGSSRFDLMIEPPVSGVEMYHSLSQQQQQQSDQISDNQSNSTTTTTVNNNNVFQPSSSSSSAALQNSNEQQQIQTNSLSTSSTNISATPISTDSFSHWNPSPIISKPLTFTRYALFDSFYDQPSSSSSSNHTKRRRIWSDTPLESDESINDIQRLKILSSSSSSSIPLATPPTNNHFSLMLKSSQQQQQQSLSTSTTSYPKESIKFDDDSRDDMNLDYDLDEMTRVNDEDNNNDNNDSTPNNSDEINDNNDNDDDGNENENNDNDHLTIHQQQPHSIRIIATQNGSLYGIKANDDNQITNNNDGDMLNSSGTTSNQNFIIPDQIMPYMNAYSTHLNSDLKQLSSGSMIGNQVKPISNDDVFIVHHQHHYPPMFMNSESSIQSAGSTNQASSIIQQNGGSSNLSPATQTSFRPLKKMQKSNKKKSKKLQIVYIKVPLLNLMDGTSAPTSTTTMTTKSATSKHHTSMEIDDSDSESQEDTIDTTISLSATPDSTTTTTTTTTTTPKPELFINDNNNDNKQQWNKREHSTSSTNNQLSAINLFDNSSPSNIDIDSNISQDHISKNSMNNKQMDLNDRFYYFLMNKLKNLTINNGETMMMMNDNDNGLKKNYDNNYLTMIDQQQTKSKTDISSKPSSMIEQQHYQSEAIPISKHHHHHHYEIYDKDSLINERDNSIIMDSASVTDKDANASTTSYQSTLEPLLYHYTPGANNTWPPEKSLGILPILIQIEDKKSDNENDNQNNNNNNGQQQQRNTIDYRNNNNNNNNNAVMQDRLYGQPSLNNDWSQRDANNPNNNNNNGGGGFSNANNNNQWPISSNKQQQQHPARNIIFHNNKPTSLAINPSASNIYPDYRHYQHPNTNLNRLRFNQFSNGGIGSTSYNVVDDERFNEHLLNMMNGNPIQSNNNVHHPIGLNNNNNKLLNPLYTSASDSHLNYFGPMIIGQQPTKSSLLPTPTASSIPFTSTPSIINVNHLLGNNNNNLNYRLLEYWLLRNQMSKLPAINHLNRMKINQDFFTAMQSKLMSSPKLMTSSSASTPFELENIYFQNGPGYAYGNFMKMPDKYREAILSSKLLGQTSSASIINPLDVSTKDLATLAALLWQQQQQQQSTTTTNNNNNNNNKDANNNNNNNNENNKNSINNKKRTRSSLKTALAKQFSLSGLTSSSSSNSAATTGTMTNTGNNDKRMMIKDDSTTADSGSSLLDKRKKSRRNLTKFGLFG
ncbi:uncharacterized protein LOC113789673 [Dermatophagoides pteronyssinus]|uniref:uncharacterized protein LOC113789673 n=1 Tax=Dermatophagoides pteronyssinus TaxID=6956 RepID=UPI003F66956D